MHVRNHEIAVDHITAAFMLHNFIISEGEQLIDVSMSAIWWGKYYMQQYAYT